ncbi:glycoside hydrolase family 76 protein [Kocuria sp. KD4]|uniref:glycoside hydrolase family 76 protein n=1 Tax=Kocuria sp. KD4 TaxID=2719588 RepID=UPI0014279350|nr:glycoside hydrolase family 76 protein [Kocuria sp. KD4]QIR68928.1 glycosidase [Kocuria sp. KD4]
MSESPAHRAAKAAHSVDHLFGARALRMPGTYLGAVAFPRPWRGPWHYWWQAHLLDAFVDAAARERHAGNQDTAELARSRAHRLLRGIAVHSGGRVTNNVFFDDMAWLALALGRLRDENLAATGRTSRAVQDDGAALATRLASGCDDTMGGGAWWNTTRDYKNTASTAPVALTFLRMHRTAEARALLTWLFDTLFDAERGVFLDGIRMAAAGSGKEITSVDPHVYTYNSGPALGAALELAEVTADPAERALWLDRAARLVHGAAREFTVPGPHGAPVLRGQGGGDAGLFTGILVRYLGEAASSSLLDDDARATARALVTDTADALWDGRREFDPNEDFTVPAAVRTVGETVAVFSPEPAQHANQAQRAGAPVELSTQVQAWTVLETAARSADR